MDTKFIKATPDQAEMIGLLVIQLTQEICERTNVQYFDLNVEETTNRCKELLTDGYYSAIVGFHDNTPVAVATMAETHALYAGGKIGILQEFYVVPEFRSFGIGSRLIDEVRIHGHQEGWACIELCTPPLPEFDRTLAFYQANGLAPVGGRKMRQSFD